MRKKYKAFTLVELLIVIVIIGILAGLIIFALRTATLRARDAKAKNSVREVQTALETYMTDNPDLTDICPVNTFCSVDSNVRNLIEDTVMNEPLLKSVPTDGQNRVVAIKFPNVNSYEIYGRSGLDKDMCWYVKTNESNLSKSKTDFSCPNGMPNVSP